ncbi:DUF1918 domain-containing protein [Nocardia pseudovaccinii]|uniref:DUF1918 domain-containing protein n=1 Tax=Nocardia pseudovaccinii TaxID=189540 RepID=UPI003D89F545
MHAKPGDWLVVEARTIDGDVRRGLIEEVHGVDGAPPYLVHWVDTGHRALTFPGPDSHVLSATELRAEEESAASRFSAMQRSSQRGAKETRSS